MDTPSSPSAVRGVGSSSPALDMRSPLAPKISTTTVICSRKRFRPPRSISATREGEVGPVDDGRRPISAREGIADPWTSGRLRGLSLPAPWFVGAFSDTPVRSLIVSREACIQSVVHSVSAVCAPSTGTWVSDASRRNEGAVSRSQPADVQLRDEMGAPTPKPRRCVREAPPLQRRRLRVGSRQDHRRRRAPGSGADFAASLTRGRWSGGPGATAALKTVLSRGI
ncbi:MAG: hypothetical protein QOG79_7269 [Mycobacterium sp.]|nr:hypothetical protein [Mycobacterium sp.]